MSNIWVSQIGYYVPERIVTNDDLINDYQLKMKAEWIKKRVGIETRRWARDDQAASDLAVEAIRKAGLQDFKGALFLSTVSPDFPTPSTSVIVKRKMQWQNSFPAIDINAACSGFIFALQTAYQHLLATNETEALVVATEVRSRFLNKQDRGTVFLFADGAAVVKLTKQEKAPGHFKWSKLISFPTEDNEIFILSGGSANPFSAQTFEEGSHFIKMSDGSKIFEQTTNSLVDIIQTQLAERNEKVSDYDFFCFHQGNGAIIRVISEKLNIPESKTHVSFGHLGNTSSASVGICLAEAYERKLITEGSKVLMVTMGAGYHIGLASLVWGLK